MPAWHDPAPHTLCCCPCRRRCCCRWFLRRHGDEVERLPGGYYRAHGRVDDTMNLGGIKTSSVELERTVVEGVAGVVEAAAVACPAPGEGVSWWVSLVGEQARDERLLHAPSLFKGELSLAALLASHCSLAHQPLLDRSTSCL